MPKSFLIRLADGGRDSQSTLDPRVAPGTQWSIVAKQTARQMGQPSLKLGTDPPADVAWKLARAQGGHGPALAQRVQSESQIRKPRACHGMLGPIQGVGFSKASASIEAIRHRACDLAR